MFVKARPVIEVIVGSFNPAPEKFADNGKPGESMRCEFWHEGTLCSPNRPAQPEFRPFRAFHRWISGSQGGASSALRTLLCPGLICCWPFGPRWFFEGRHGVFVSGQRIFGSELSGF